MGRRGRAWRAAAVGSLVGGLVLVGWLSGSPAGAHPYEVTTAQLDWNGASGVFEVALRLSPEQLARILRAGPAPATPTDTSSLDAILASYLREHLQLFAVEAGSAQRPELRSDLRWVGRENEGGAEWLYFELVPPASLPPTHWTLRNTLFLEDRPRQLNTTRVRVGQRQKSWVLSREKSEIALSTLEKDPDTAASDTPPPTAAPNP